MGRNSTQSTTSRETLAVRAYLTIQSAPGLCNNSDLAGLLGESVDRVDRVLSKLEGDGMILRGERGKWILQHIVWVDEP